MILDCLWLFGPSHCVYTIGKRKIVKWQQSVCCGNVRGWVRGGRCWGRGGVEYTSRLITFTRTFLTYLPRRKAVIKLVFLHVPIIYDWHKITDHNNLKIHFHFLDIIVADYSSKLFLKSRFTKIKFSHFTFTPRNVASLKKHFYLATLSKKMLIVLKDLNQFN